MVDEAASTFLGSQTLTAVRVPLPALGPDPAAGAAASASTGWSSSDFVVHETTAAPAAAAAAPATPSGRKAKKEAPPPKVRAMADLRGRGGNLPAPACPRIRRSSSSPPSSPRGVQTANARAALKRRATTSDIAATSSATFVDGVAVLSRQPFPDGSAPFVLADDSVLHLQASGRRVRMWADGRKGRGGAATHGRLKEDEQIAAASPGRRSTRRARSSSGAGSISSAASDAMWRALPVPLRTSTCDERSSRIL